MGKSLIFQGILPVNSWSTLAAFRSLFAMMSTGSSTESDMQATVPVNGTFSLFSASPSTTPGSVTTYNFRKNGADGNVAVVLQNAAGGGTGAPFTDTTHTDTLTAGDLYCGHCSGGSSSNRALAIAFSATSGQVALYSNSTSITSTTTSVDIPLSGPSNTLNTGFLVATPGAWGFLEIRTNGGNTLNGNLVATSLKNGSTGNQTVTLGSAVTGSVRDTTHTDSVTAGDLLGWRITEAASSGSSSVWVNSAITATSGAASDWGAAINQAARSASATANFYNLGGTTTAGNTTEASVQMASPFAFTLSRFKAYLSANSTNNTLTITMRKNGADTANTVAFGSAVTGWIEDTTHTDSIAQGDLLCLKLVGGTAGNGTLSQRGFKYDDGSGVVVVNSRMFLVFPA